MSKHAILCVDDEFDNVDALERLFRKKYRILKATSGQQALDLLAAHPEIALILSDQRMPEMTGVEMLKKSIKTHPSAIRMLLTGYTDINSVVDAINTGEIYRYLAKPWDPVDLANTVDKAIEKYELTRELEVKNRELEKALTELKTLDQAKTQFMVLVNHELKTPLTTILSFAQLLKETSLDEEQLKYTQRVETSGLRLKEIVDDVMQLLQAETGMMKVKTQKYSLTKLIPKLPKSVQAEFEKKSLTLQVDLGKHQVKADSDVIQNVLARILHNAVKFSSEKSEIKIKAQALKDQIYIEVENHGETLSPSAIERIFKPFTLNEEMMNHSRGMGLGLSLCQALLKCCDSALQIESANKRVRVGFSLPVA